MALRINTNVDAIGIHNQMQKVNENVSTSLKRLSSGLRINSARDDASGWAISNNFKAKVSSMKIAQQNTTEAQSLLQTADGAYSKVNDILVRMKALATQASSGQTENLATMNNEFVNLQQEIDRIANSTTYGSTKLVDGTQYTNGTTFQIGATNASNNQLNIKISGATSGCLAVGSSTTNISTASGAQAAMTALDTALTSINYFMGEIGAAQNRLQYTSENLSISMENMEASISAITDVDMASEIMTFTRNQILQQSSMAMLAQANQAPQSILTLLR